MSQNDRDRNGGLLGDLFGLVLTLVLWYWAFKFLSFIVIAMSQLIYELFKALIKLTIYIADSLGKAIKFGFAYLSKSNDMSKMRTSAKSVADGEVILTRPYSALDQTQVPAFVRKRLVASGQVSFGEKGLPQSEAASREEFRARNPFVKIDVPSVHFDRFLAECKWLEGRTGNFPSKEDQVAILNELGM